MSIKNPDNVRIEECKEFPVAYIRHKGPYEGDQELFGRLYGELCQWAEKNGFMDYKTVRFIACYYQDPKETAPEELIMDACISIPSKDFKPEGNIQFMTIPGGKFAIGHFEIDVNQYGEAWTYLMEEWIPANNLKPRPAVCFEDYLNNPEEHPQKKHIVDIYEPVE